MKRAIAASICILLSATAIAIASDVANQATKKTGLVAAQSPTKEQSAKTVFPKWDVSFELAQNPVHLPTNTYPAKIVGQKYVSKFVMIVPVQDAYLERDNAPEFVELGQQVHALRDAFLLSEEQKRIVWYMGKLPQSVRPAHDVAEELLPPYFMAMHRGPDAVAADAYAPGFACRSFRFFTQTADRPKVLIKTLLDAYGYGIALPEQSRFLMESNDVSREAAGYQQWLDEMPAAIADDTKQLDALREFEDVSAEALNKFKVERRALDIDRAAAKGRVEACQKILHEGAGTAKEQIVAAKFAAEIDLSGLDSKHAAIERIVVNAQKRLDLYQKLADDKIHLQSARQYLGPSSKAARETAESARAWTTCPIVGKVVTSEILWEK